jgi:class 3 adenylate cyclase
MRFRLLGPLEIDDVADEALLRRAKPRALLALLLLSANRPVGTDRLVAGLWGEDEPATALGALQNYVSQLRKALGRDVVVTRAPGYMAVVGPDELDVERFERLVAEAADSDVSGRAACLREALSLWRGPPLADLADEPFAGAEIRRLDELRLAALEDRIAADLELGRHGELVAELEALVQEHPLRERVRALLMLALYRGGRQAEALAAYRDGRKLFDEELGLEPGDELQRLERAILRHDPELDAPSASAVRAAEGAPMRSGRRTVTVIFADVSGSTELGESLDPETLRDLMSTFFEEMRGAIVRHGGTVEKFAGDEVMAVFGAPVAHEDDPLRAVRAAEEMLTAVQALDEALERDRGVRFQLRIGINTGEAVAGEASAGGTFVTGPAVNIGKRLQELAEPGDAVLGEGTMRLVRDAVEVEPLGSVALRGRAEPLEAYRLVSVQAGAPGVARAFDSPFVGRRDEIDALRVALSTAQAERRCLLVALVGNAGIGKTRIAREFVESLDDARVLVGRCVPYGDGATYLPLVDALRDVLPELGEVLDDDLMGRISALVGGDETPATAGDTAWAVRRSFEILAREHPLVLVFDDVHWAEPTFLDLIEYLGAWTDDAPILLLALARPDLLEERPTWADPAVGVATLRLGPLDNDDTRALVADLAGDSVDEDQRDRVVELAEGYPLFAEQLVAWIEEAGGEGDLTAVPATIESLLASRLDRLDHDERAVLERAAVVGREFWRGAVAAVSPQNELAAVNRHLMSLVRKGLVRPAPSELAREDALRFHHVLIRDVAYAGIPKSVRADLHERAADWLEQRAGEPDEVVGYHLEQAHRYRSELGPGDRAVRRLGAEAGERLGRAGVRALARGDSPAAVNLLARASSILPSADSQRLELLSELGVAYRLAGDLARADHVLAQAVEEARAARDRRQELRAQIEQAAVRLNADPEGVAGQLLELAETAIPVFEALGDDRALGRTWFLTGFAQGSFYCRNSAWEDASERALTHYRRAAWPTTTCLQGIAAALFYGSRPAAEAIRRCDELLTQEVSDLAGKAHVILWRGALAALGGEFDAARDAVAVARRTYAELGQSTTATIGCDFVGGLAEELAGDYRAAERILGASAEKLQRLGESALLATRAAELANVLYKQARYAEADEWTRVAREHSSSDDISAEFTWRSVRSKVVAQAGAHGEGEELARDALELVDRTDALNQRANVRLDLAHVLQLAERIEEAASTAADAAVLYERKGNTIAAEQAQRLVQLLARV